MSIWHFRLIADSFQDCNSKNFYGYNFTKWIKDDLTNETKYLINKLEDLAVPEYFNLRNTLPLSDSNHFINRAHIKQIVLRFVNINY